MFLDTQRIVLCPLFNYSSLFLYRYAFSFFLQFLSFFSQTSNFSTYSNIPKMAHIQSNYAIIKLPNLIRPKIAQLMKYHSDMAPIRMYWIFVFILSTIIILHAEYWILNLFRFHVFFPSRSVDCDNFFDSNHLLIFFKNILFTISLKNPPVANVMQHIV